MSGGKETPRQKMIGMMYLVLTALLALQVSNAVLEKFIFIDQTLQRARKEGEAKSTKTVGRIEAEVKKKGDRESDVKALEKAKQVRQMTNALVNELDALREEMATITGGYDENNKLVGAKDIDKVGAMMIYGGKGKELKDKLNKYTTDLATLTGDAFAPLAKDAKDIDVAKNDPDQKEKKFAEYYFENTPTAAGMATMSQMETEILAYEQQALDRIAEEVGAKDVSFDLIKPMVLPQSNIVAAGTKFEGDLFISASSSAVNPTMTFEGKELEVVEGRGKISFVATPGAYDKDGYAKKTFKATITLSDSTYDVEHEYVVAKPIIQIQSAAISSLYLNCGNELNVQVPALGSAYNPSFTTSGAENIKGAQKGIVTIIPTAPKVTLTVRSDGNLIGSQDFTVKRIPKPNVEISDRGKPINLKTGVPAPGPRSINIRAVPDETFASLLPKDARYRVSEWELTLARGSRPVVTEKIRSESFNMSQQILSQAKSGDRIVIEVKRVQRMNYQGKTEEVTGLPNTIFSINLN